MTEPNPDSIPTTPAPAAGPAPIPARATPMLKHVFSHQDLGKALARIKGQTTLPDSRVREVLSEAVRHVESFPGDGVVEPVDQAVMLTMHRLWADAPRSPHPIDGVAPTHSPDAPTGTEKAGRP